LAVDIWKNLATHCLACDAQGGTSAVVIADVGDLDANRIGSLTRRASNSAASDHRYADRPMR